MTNTKISDLTEDTSPTEDDLVATVNDPSGTPASRNVALKNLGVILGILHVRDQRIAGNDGGTSFNNVNTRILSDVVTNTIVGSSLSSSLITLPIGTYLVDATAPALAPNEHRAYLYNTSDSAIEVLGISCHASSTDTTTSIAQVKGQFTITAEKIFGLRHFITSGRSTDGLGISTGDGSIDIYASVIITKIG